MTIFQITRKVHFIETALSALYQQAFVEEESRIVKETFIAFLTKEGFISKKVTFASFKKTLPLHFELNRALRVSLLNRDNKVFK